MSHYFSCPSSWHVEIELGTVSVWREEERRRRERKKRMASGKLMYATMELIYISFNTKTSI